VFHTTLLAFAALCGCSGGGDVPIGADVPTSFYVSPEGSDLNPGTRSRPWYSLAFATEQLRPGDTLQLAAGEYTPDTTGVLSVDCRGTAQLGLPGAPIVVRAEVERSVKLKGDGALVPLRLEGCAHWIVEGLVLTNEHRLDVPSGVDVGSVALVLESRDVTLRRLLMASSNNARHSHLLRLLHSENVLVEECEAYDFYHNAFEAVRTDRITFRRNYLHSRYAAAAGAYSGSGMRGEVGIQIEESRDALLENNLAEVVVNGFAVVGRHARSPFDEPPPYPPGGARMYGNLVRDSLGFGFRIESRCEAADPCELPERLASSTQVVDGVVFEAAGGVSTCPIS